MMRRFCLAVTLLLAAVGPARADWHAREEAIMGTRIAVEIWHEDAAAAEAAIEAVIAEMHRIDALMSTYKPESQVSRVNREAAAGPVTVDPELARLVARALEFSAMSGGRLRHHLRERRLPVRLPGRQAPDATPRSRRRCRPSTGATWSWISSASTIRFLKPGVRIDLGGIAKGHAVDSLHRAPRGARHPQRDASRRAATAGSSATAAGGHGSSASAIPDDRERVVARIPLEDAAISTSGDYERFFDEDGVRYHHIIDPKTGKSPHGVRSVTIIAPTSTLAEGLTKSVFILGPERGHRAR